MGPLDLLGLVFLGEVGQGTGYCGEIRNEFLIVSTESPKRSHLLLVLRL